MMDSSTNFKITHRQPTWQQITGNNQYAGIRTEIDICGKE